MNLHDMIKWLTPVRINGRADVKADTFTPIHAGPPLVLLPGTKLNYAREVGDGLGSSVVIPPLNWIARNFSQAPPLVERLRKDEWSAVREHPLTDLLSAPNPFYGGRELWMATAIEFSFGGNAYWLTIRNAEGDVVQLWWVPSAMMTPRWPTDGTTYIDHYDYTPGGRMIRVAVDDVVHLRNGLDPRNHRLGLAPLGALAREIFTDDQAANFTSVILKNLGIIGVVISPKERGLASKEDLEATKRYLLENFTGDKRGEPLALGQPTEVQVLQYNLQGLDVSPLRDVAEERVCLHPSTQIITKRGVVPITDVCAGDEVVTHRGRWRKVITTVKTPAYEPMIEIRADGLDPLRVTVSHRVMAATYHPQRAYRLEYRAADWIESDGLVPRSRGGRRAWHALTIPVLRDEAIMTTLDLLPHVEGERFSLRDEDGRLVHPSPRVHAIARHPALSAAFGRLLGFYLAEGSSVESRVYWYFHENETEYAESVQADLADVFGVPSHVRAIPRHHVRAVVVQSAMLARLFDLGAQPERRLPLWAWCGDEKFRHAMLEAWVAGDGHIEANGSVRVTTMSRDLAWQMRLVAIACGYAASIREHRRGPGMIGGRPVAHSGPVYTVAWSSPSVTRQRRYRIEDTAWWTGAVRSGEAYAYDGPVYNLKVEDDESYLTTGGLVHNCAALGIPAAVVGFGTGLQTTKVGVTMREMRRMAWTDAIIPMQESIAAQVARQLLAGFESRPERARLRFDLSAVPALMEDTNEKHARVRADYLAGMIKRAQAKRELGYPVESEDEIYAQPLNVMLLKPGEVPEPAPPKPPTEPEGGEP